MAVPLLVAAVVMEGASMYEQHEASRQAAGVANATAAYNAKLDVAQAQQIELDTKANIRTERQDNAVYLSRQKAAYAAAGVLQDGSPLAVQATTAGRMEQRIQQEWQNSQLRAEQLQSKAKAGIAYGAAEAEADRMAGTIALLNGGAKLAQMGLGAYESGIFGGGSTTGPKGG